MVKGIVNAFDHTEFCLVLNLTTTCASGKWVVIWTPIFATRYVSLQPTSAPGSKCLLSAKKVYFHHCYNSSTILVVLSKSLTLSFMIVFFILKVFQKKSCCFSTSHLTIYLWYKFSLLHWSFSQMKYMYFTLKQQNFPLRITQPTTFLPNISEWIHQPGKHNYSVCQVVPHPSPVKMASKPAGLS